MSEKQKKAFALILADFMARRDDATWLVKDQLTEEERATCWEALNELE
jgi:hypothetical protein